MAQRLLRKLELYAFPYLGKLSADQVETKHLIKALQPLWSTKTRTADEVRGQIEQILDAARARGLRTGENPARWRGHLENLLSRHEKKKARKRQHYPALRWQDLPKLMEVLRKDPSHVSVAAQLLILTGARSHMVRFARWDEFDLESGRWSLPDERMKARQAFAIPLAPQVVSLLKSLPKINIRSPYVFPGNGQSGVMHANGIRNLLHTHWVMSTSLVMASAQPSGTGQVKRRLSQEISASSHWPMTSAGKRKVRTLDQTFLISVGS